jgi:hypothetical protein
MRFFFTAIPTVLATLAAILSLPASSFAFGTNPQLPYAGAPGQGTCASCHGSLTAGSGITVMNAPSSYTPGATTPISMTVTLPATGGFELEVVTQGNAQAGVLAAGDANGGVRTSGGIQFADSTQETTSWTFNWTPPTTNVGNVVLYVTGGTHGTNYSNSYPIMASAAGNPAPSIASFVAGSATITAGNSTTLTGVFSNGTGTVDNNVGTVTTNTPVTVTPSSTTTYTLTVTGTGTPATKQVTVTVTPATKPPTITSFAASPGTITAGNSSMLTAVFSNGTGSVDNGVGTVTSGQVVTVSPTATTTYKLTVTGTGTPATMTAKVTVNSSTGTGTLAATPSSLAFTYRMGGTVPRRQTLAIASTSGPTSYSATETDPWLSITPTSGNTPGSLRASINPAGMAAGTYGAQINISTPNGMTVSVPVSLTITSGSGGGGGTSGGMSAQAYMYDPTQSGALAAAWVDNLGTTPHNTSDPLNQGLVLAKDATAPTGSLTGAVITNVQGSLTELGFDYRAGGQCTSTSPRFLVVISGVTHVVQGCSAVTTAAPMMKGWNRVRFNLADTGQTSPPITPGQQVSSITLVLDQGPGTASAAGGLVVIDNIDVNGTFVGKGTTATTTPPPPTPPPTPRDD